MDLGSSEYSGSLDVVRMHSGLVQWYRICAVALPLSILRRKWKSHSLRLSGALCSHKSEFHGMQPDLISSPLRSQGYENTSWVCIAPSCEKASKRMHWGLEMRGADSVKEKVARHATDVSSAFPCAAFTQECDTSQFHLRATLPDSAVNLHTLNSLGGVSISNRRGIATSCIPCVCMIILEHLQSCLATRIPN